MLLHAAATQRLSPEEEEGWSQGLLYISAAEEQTQPGTRSNECTEKHFSFIQRETKDRIQHEFPHLLFQTIPRCPESTLLSAQLGAASYGGQEGHHWSPLLSEAASEAVQHLTEKSENKQENKVKLLLHKNTK